MPRPRTGSFGGKSDGIGKMVKLLEDDERFSSRCGSSYQRSGSSSSVYFGNFDSFNGTGSGKQESYTPSSSSSLGLNRTKVLTAVQNVGLGSSDESGSDFDIESGSRHLLESHGIPEPDDWVNTSALSHVDEVASKKDDSLGVKSGASSSNRGQSLHPLSWRERYMLQNSRMHDSMIKNTMDGRPQRLLTAGPSQRVYRKGSSSKAPQTDDLTAPLLLEKKSISDKSVQGGGEGHASNGVAAFGSRNRNASNLRRVAYSTNITSEVSSRRKGNSQNLYGHRAKSEETGAGHRDSNNNGSGSSRRGLSNLGCSSTADVLPSISTAALSNFACSSAADVLPSVPSALAGTRSFRPRKSSRALGLTGEGNMSMQSVNRQAEDVDVLGMREHQNGLPQDQVTFGSGLTASQPTRAPQNRQESMRTDFMTCETSLPSSTAPSMLPNYREWERNVAFSRSGDGLGSLYRTSSPFFEGNPAFGEELSNHWSARRRSLYGSRVDAMGPDNRSSSRNLSRGRPSGSTWSVLREIHYPQSRFPRPPTRPPPLPPPADFAEPNPSESSFTTSPLANSTDYSRSSSFVLPVQATEQASATPLAETGSFSSSTSGGEGRSRLTVEGLSEILSALEHIERDEDLSYEQILMLEATILLGGIGLHDRYRDMRVDIDNMSYEELLALEERIGNVNIGLGEESFGKCLQVEIFLSPDVTCGYVPQEIEVKCSICQEEFEKGVELGVLECGHSHHIACIKQWLLQKNQCPICKAPAMS